MFQETGWLKLQDSIFQYRKRGVASFQEHILRLFYWTKNSLTLRRSKLYFSECRKNSRAVISEMLPDNVSFYRTLFRTAEKQTMQPSNANNSDSLPTSEVFDFER